MAERVDPEQSPDGSMRTARGAAVAGREFAKPHFEPEGLLLMRSRLLTNLFGQELEGPTIGRYPILTKLGQGAMGVVYACYDAQLDRRVAVKVLRGDVDSERVHVRMEREAMAMARLNHPNVVHVYEVGKHHGRTFVVMEHVVGQTLRQWSGAAKRSWTEVLDACLAAGRGLVAAHQQGLTHRDFKPDNVMVGDDGRVRVMDFGLVRFTSSSAHSSSAGESGSSADDEDSPVELTRQGAVLGTPAYMAPEQMRGSEAGPAADQFAFCVTVWECLCGARPFPDRTPQERAAPTPHRSAILPASARVPKWLRNALVRGLSAEPGERWPSMQALLATLERGRSRARRRRVGLALVLLAVGGLGLVAAHEVDVERRTAACEASGAAIAEVWNDEARTRIREGLRATGVRYADVAAQKIAERFNAVAQAWQDARTEACLDDELRGVTSPDMVDRSQWCFEDRSSELAVLIDTIAHADAAVAAAAIEAAWSVNGVEPCRDSAMLLRSPTPPLEQRDEVRAIREELSRVTALGRSSPEQLAQTSTLIERADAVGWGPLEATTRLAHAKLLERNGAYADAERFATAAYFEAAAAGAWELAARAATELVTFTGPLQRRMPDALTWSKHAEVALGHAGESGGLREALRLGALAKALESNGDILEARALDERALAIEEAVQGPDHPSVAKRMLSLAVTYRGTGDYDEMIRLCERALEISEHAFGSFDVQVETIIGNLGLAHQETGNYQRALELHQRALATAEEIRPPGHPRIAVHLANLGNVHTALGNYAEGQAYHQRAIAIREASLGPEHPLAASTLRYMADGLLASGNHAAARPLYERAVGIAERASGPEHVDTAVFMQHLARWHEATGSFDEARRLHERALDICAKKSGRETAAYAVGVEKLADGRVAAGDLAEALELYRQVVSLREATLDPEHPLLARSLVDVAQIEHALGRPELARPLLERALAIYERRRALGEDEPEARFALARVLVATGGDRARAQRLAEEARERYAAVGRGRLAELAEIDAWLSGEHGPRSD